MGALRDRIMTKEIRLFERLADGKFSEVDRAIQGTRRASRVSLEIDLLWTAEEEAARAEEEAAAAQEKLAREQLKATIEATRDEALNKLAALGLTVDDLKAIGAVPING